MKRRVHTLAAGILLLAMFAGCARPGAPETTAGTETASESSAASPEAAGKKDESAGAGQQTAALQEAFRNHDDVDEAFTALNSRAEQRTRSGWYSNLTAEEEQEVIDSMNEHFKEAVLERAWKSLGL